jgi:hypothetical protein
MMMAVKTKDPIATVSLLSLAADMDVSMDVEDILAGSSTSSQWDCSSMLPNDDGQDVYNSVREKFHYLKPIFLLSRFII